MFNKDIVVKGMILSGAAFAGSMGFKYGCRLFDRMIPNAVEKINIVGSMAATLRSDDDYEE